MNHDKLRDFVDDHREDFEGATPPLDLWDRIESDLPNDDENDDADPLAEFIALHRDAFDDVSPPPQLFAKTVAPATAQGEAEVEAEAEGKAEAQATRSMGKRPRGETPKAKVRPLRFILSIAASLLLLVSAYYFGSRAGYQAGQQDTRVATELRDLDPELAEAERFYQQRIAGELTKVSQVNNDPELYRNLEEIDQATKELREQLLTLPPSQRAGLVNRLIETYRTKLDILLRIQQHLPHQPPAPTPADNKETNEL